MINWLGSIILPTAPTKLSIVVKSLSTLYNLCMAQPVLRPPRKCSSYVGSMPQQGKVGSHLIPPHLLIFPYRNRIRTKEWIKKTCALYRLLGLDQQLKDDMDELDAMGRFI
jgi:hypothetical protein